jgi:hypothetical protein
MQHGTAPSVRHCKLQCTPGHGGVSFEAHPKQIQTASTDFFRFNMVQRYLQQLCTFYQHPINPKKYLTNN